MNGPGVTVPLGKGKLPAMEISVNHDQVNRIQALTSEMSALRENYNALGSSKDAVDRRAIDLQRELEATRSRADAGTVSTLPSLPTPLPPLSLHTTHPLHTLFLIVRIIHIPSSLFQLRQHYPYCKVKKQPKKARMTYA